MPSPRVKSPCSTNCGSRGGRSNLAEYRSYPHPSRPCTARGSSTSSNGLAVEAHDDAARSSEPPMSTLSSRLVIFGPASTTAAKRTMAAARIMTTGCEETSAQNAFAHMKVVGREELDERGCAEIHHACIGSGERILSMRRLSEIASAPQTPAQLASSAASFPAMRHAERRRARGFDRALVGTCTRQQERRRRAQKASRTTAGGRRRHVLNVP